MPPRQKHKYNVISLLSNISWAEQIMISNGIGLTPLDHDKTKLNSFIAEETLLLLLELQPKQHSLMGLFRPQQPPPLPWTPASANAPTQQTLTVLDARPMETAWRKEFLEKKQRSFGFQKCLVFSAEFVGYMFLRWNFSEFPGTYLECLTKAVRIQKSTYLLKRFCRTSFPMSEFVKKRLISFAFECISILCSLWLFPSLQASLFFNRLAATNITGFSETLSLAKKSLSLPRKSLSLVKKSLSLTEKSLSLGKSDWF